MKSKATHKCLYGIHSVKEALIANKRNFSRIFVNQNSRNSRLAEIIEMARKRRIDISQVSSTKLSNLAQHEDHQQIVAHVSSLPLVEIRQMTHTHAFIIICDQIMDPHNMGAIIRTSLAAGATGLITTKDNSTPLSATVSKISSGAMEHLPIARVTNLVRCIDTLKSGGVWVSGLDAHASLSLHDARFDPPVALIIGSEQKGIRRLVCENCDQMIHIPQMGPLDSLNASVAAGIAMYEVFRQRKYARSCS